MRRKLSRVRDSYAAGVDTLEEYRKYRADVDAEKAAILERLSDLRGRENPEETLSVLRERLGRPVGVLEDPGTGKELKNSVARSILASCQFDKKSMTLQIVYRAFL